ncbi:uncharacterized protein LOC141651702 [Silene latifolia]|uniref:uncharacterized protein LOC141651702 n=1 Tax=Silene latifolia TaxID=37657 RepID=UPI003D76DA05
MTWKNVCKVKEKFKHGFTNGVWSPHAKGYTVSHGYAWLGDHGLKVNWWPLVWNNWNIPKHSIISWLIFQEGLNLKTRLFQIGCCEDDLCLLCGEVPETYAHLTTDCPFSRKIAGLTEAWNGRKFPTINALQTGRQSSMQWKAMTMLMNAFLYTIWYHRNQTRLLQAVTRPEIVASQLEQTVRMRGRSKVGEGLDRAVDCWQAN